MTEKRYSHDAIVIVDHLKEDLIYIDGKDELLELAEYVDRLQEENLKLKRALLFYLDLAIQDSSYLNDGFEKGMELWCQRLFNCSYEQAKEYKDFEWINVWEMGE